LYNPLTAFSVLAVYQEIAQTACDWPAGTSATIAGQVVSQYNGHFIA
jgi:hypothetical protein